MKVHLVSEHASPLAVLGGVDAGGQNVHVAELATGLARLGHSVVVHTRRDGADLPERAELSPGVTVEHVPAGPPKPVPKDDLLPYVDDFGDHLARRWAADPPDLVHAHFWMSGLAACRGAAGLDLPVLQTFHALGRVKRRHQGELDTSPRDRPALEAGLAGRVDAVLATCSDEVDELAGMGMPRDRAAIVPCGIDLAKFRPDGPRFPRGERPRVVSIGRLVERKGVDAVIEALAAVPDAELLVAGGPAPPAWDTDPEVARLRRIARERGVADRVVFLGPIDHDDAPALYRSADVVVTAPWYEPFGTVPLEAMACGVPPVATAVGGHLDTVVDGGTGLLVPPRDRAALAAALRDLLTRPARRADLGAAGVRRVREKYAWDRLVRDTETVYRGVLAARRPRATATGGAP
ncbi:glycosyltransferase [Saccharopolyspora sp. CA-218241]|uniref:glycosyltransferase n=1 Tax=Saccharopolyspora sp. CA-218241 TaxID=3240027 RepID=UPI003D97D2D8